MCFGTSAPPAPPDPAPMAAARPPHADDRPADTPADGVEEEFVEEGFASFEVGAGVPGDVAGRTPFLRAVLSDDARGADAASPPARGPVEIGPDEGDREVVVRDRFARLDAGLPPLPEGEDGDDEDLSPVVHRPPAEQTAPARPVTAPAAPPVRVGTPPATRERTPDREPAPPRTWQHLAPPAPRLATPAAERPAPPRVVAPPPLSAVAFADEAGENSAIVSFAAAAGRGTDPGPRSVDFESAAEELTEPVAAGYSVAADDRPEPPAPPDRAARPPAARPFRKDDDDDDPPRPAVRPIFRTFSG